MVFKEKLKKALISSSKMEYEKLREKRIKEKGYDTFRKEQKEVFEDMFSRARYTV